MLSDQRNDGRLSSRAPQGKEGVKQGVGGEIKRTTGDSVDCQHLPDATSLGEQREEGE